MPGLAREGPASSSRCQELGSPASGDSGVHCCFGVDGEVIRRKGEQCAPSKGGVSNASERFT
jgi:hypothetical protein